MLPQTIDMVRRLWDPSDPGTWRSSDAQRCGSQPSVRSADRR